MTAPFRQMITCPHCGKEHTSETAFNRWLRGHPQFDSVAEGIVRFDCDILLHRYKLHIDGIGSRKIQCMMFIEVKTHSAKPTQAQRDTLYLFDQVLRNRGKNKHQDTRKRRQATDHHPPVKAISLILRQKIGLRLFGGHLLTFSKDDPANSEWIRWDKHLVGIPTLIRLLKFELDPDTLKLMDWRRRYKSVGRPSSVIKDDLLDTDNP